MPEAAPGTTTGEGRPHLVTHSGRGCRYRWPGWVSTCGAAGVARSVLRAKAGECIAGHSEKRRKRPLGGMSPLQYRKSLGLAA